MSNRKPQIRTNTTVVRSLVRPRTVRRPIRTLTIKRNIVNNPTIRQRSNKPIQKKRKNKKSNKTIRKPKPMDSAVKSYMHCRLNPFASSGSLGIPDNSNQPRVVVDHRLICNFTAGSSGGFYIAVMPWLPHPLLVRPSTMNDPSWLFNGYHPVAHNGALTGDNYYFAPATFTEWATNSVTRNNTPDNLDTVSIPYQSRRFRFVTIGARIIYTGSTMVNSGTLLINDGSFNVGANLMNTVPFTVLNAGTTDLTTYALNEIQMRSLTFSPSFNTRSNSSYNGPLRTGGYSLLVNQASDHPWRGIDSALTFVSSPSIANYSIIVSNVSDPLASGIVNGYACVQGFDDQFCPKLISVQNMSPGASFQLELVYCVEYAIDPQSSVSSLAKQPPSKPEEVMRVDSYLRNVQPNRSLASDIIHTIGETTSSTITGIAEAVSPFKKFSTRLP